MKDYFASIIKEGVTGVPRCNNLMNLKETLTFSKETISTPLQTLDVTGCTDNFQIVHLRTPLQFKGVPMEPREIAVSHHVHLRTPLNDDIDNIYELEERAAIMEYDGGLSRQEAEQQLLQTINL